MALNKFKIQELEYKTLKEEKGLRLFQCIGCGIRWQIEFMSETKGYCRNCKES